MTTVRPNIAGLRKRLEQLHEAIAAASREGNIRRDVRLTLQACRVRRQLLEAQAQMFQ
jgi:hypothetical protein